MAVHRKRSWLFSENTMEHSSFVAFVIFWCRTTVLLVLLGFLAPVECNRPAKFLLSSTVTIKLTRNLLKWYQGFCNFHG